MKCYHVSERCIHGETKRDLCAHKVLWAKRGYREVPCEPSFCPAVRPQPSSVVGWEHPTKEA